MKKTILVSLIFFVAVALPSPFYIKQAKRYYLELSLKRTLNSCQEGRDVLKKDPGFVKSIVDYPEIVSIVENVIGLSPKCFGAFVGRTDIIEELKSSSKLRRFFLYISKCPKVLSFLAEDPEYFAQFAKKYKKAALLLLKQPDYAHYLCIEHPEKLKSVLESPDPFKTGERLQEEFIIEKYLRESQ